MKKLILITASLIGSSALALGVGNSSFPMMTGKKFISTEFTGTTTDDGGMGLQVRYTQKMNPQLTMDAGIGIAGGDRSQRVFFGADYELYPDYMQQPKISLRTKLTRAEEFEETRTIVSLAPTVSKGFNVYGNEAFPYVSLPFGLNLNSDKRTYESTVSLNMGVNGRLPVEGYKHLNGNAEVQFGLKESYTAMVLGLSFPMN